ncbi:MAG: YicC family protein [Parvularculaceae bacterium]
MSVKSMTGFGRAEGQFGRHRWVWEAKSVNGRNLDLRPRLANGFDALEPQIRKAAAAKFKRGAVQVSLQLTRDAEGEEFAIDDRALTQILETIARIRKSVPEAPPPRIESVLALRGVIRTDEAEEDEAQRAALQAALLESLDAAFDALDRSRAGEGEEIASALSAILDDLERLLKTARDAEAAQPEKIRERLKQQIAEILEAAPALDPARVAQEAAILAVKADIREELDRLTAHIAAARRLLADDGPCGRKLDFLSQEFNREANTLCAKTNDSALKEIGLEMKSVIDRLREQVQNIE